MFFSYIIFICPNKLIRKKLEWWRQSCSPFWMAKYLGVLGATWSARILGSMIFIPRSWKACCWAICTKFWIDKIGQLLLPWVPLAQRHKFGDNIQLQSLHAGAFVPLRCHWLRMASEEGASSATCIAAPHLGFGPTAWSESWWPCNLAGGTVSSEFPSTWSVVDSCWF